MKDKKIFNMFRLLVELSNHETICTDEYARKLGVSVRTVQRYIENISEFFNVEFIQTSRGCYKYLNFDKVKNILIKQKDYEDFEKFANIINAIDPKLLKYFNIDEKTLSKIIDNDVFYIKSSPFEEIFNFSLFTKIKKAIKYSQHIDLEYESEKYYFYENVRPYKIVFANGNWYLVIHSDDTFNGGVKFLRLNFIKSVKLQNKTFRKKREILDFIKNFQSLMSDFDKPKYEVIVFVDNEVERHFKAKKYLDSQTIVKDTKEGLILRYYINNENEILLLAKQWLPHMKIISPQSLQTKLEKMALELLDKKTGFQ